MCAGCRYYYCSGISHTMQKQLALQQPRVVILQYGLFSPPGVHAPNSAYLYGILGGHFGASMLVHCNSPL